MLRGIEQQQHSANIGGYERAEALQAVLVPVFLSYLRPMRVKPGYILDSDLGISESVKELLAPEGWLPLADLD
jgi:hypothetical protein